MSAGPQGPTLAEGEPGPAAGLDATFAIGIDFRHWWTVIPEIVVLICTGLLPVLVAVNVLARYSNWFQVPWVNDIVAVLFLWIVFLGGALAVKHEAHVKMTMISDRVAGNPAGRVWIAVLRASPAILGAILLVLGVQIVELHMKRELPWLEIPSGYFSSVIPLSGALMIYYTARRIRRDGFLARPERPEA